MVNGLKYSAGVLILAACGMFGQAPAGRPAFEAFEVATIKSTAHEDYQGGRYMRMQSAHLIAKNYPLKVLIAAAYNVTLRAISGGPEWIESDRYDILAGTPGEVRPNLEEQLSMLRALLADRFKLTFHRERKEFPIYALTVAKTGPKLKESSAPADQAPELVSTIYPAAGGGIDHALMPGRNATMKQFASILQRAVVDRAVVDQTGLTGRYDFDLEWTPDDAQFGGELPRSTPESNKPGLFAAMQQQLGLRLEATRGPIEALVIDQVERPSDN